jgi:hypothetical protein
MLAKKRTMSHRLSSLATSPPKRTSPSRSRAPPKTTCANDQPGRHATSSRSATTAHVTPVPTSHVPIALLVRSVSGHGQMSAATEGDDVNSTIPAMIATSACTASTARRPAGTRAPRRGSMPGRASCIAVIAMSAGGKIA